MSHRCYATVNSKVVFQLMVGNLFVIFDQYTKLVDLVIRREYMRLL